MTAPILRAAFVLLLASGSVQSQQSSVDQKVPAASLRADFDTLWHALEEAHGGYERYASRREMRSLRNAHRAQLTRPITRLEFSRVISEAIADLRDGHARLELDSITTEALARAHILPLGVRFEDDRLMVISNDSPSDSTIRPGMQLTRINGKPVSQIVSSMLPTISRDGFIETGRRLRLSRQFAQYLWLYGGQAEQFQVEARDDSGRTVVATLRGILEQDRPSSLDRRIPLPYRPASSGDRQGNVVLEFIKDSSTALLRIRAFDGESFVSTLDSVFGILHDRHTQSLILDLRGNGGGVDEYGAKLISYFTTSPFRYFDRIHLTSIAPSFATWKQSTFDQTRAGTRPDSLRGGFLVNESLHSGVGVQQPSRPAFTGRLIVLIDGGSFSTTADVAAQLRSWNRATFVGEETAGAYGGNTSGLNAQVILPNSRLRLKIMMYDYWNAVRSPRTKGRGTIPDYIVIPQVRDLLRGEDRVLKRAIALSTAFSK